MWFCALLQWKNRVHHASWANRPAGGGPLQVGRRKFLLLHHSDTNFSISRWTLLIKEWKGLFFRREKHAKFFEYWQGWSWGGGGGRKVCKFLSKPVFGNPVSDHFMGDHTPLQDLVFEILAVSCPLVMSEQFTFEIHLVCIDTHARMHTHTHTHTHTHSCQPS